MDYRPYFVDSGVPGRGPLRGRARWSFGEPDGIFLQQRHPWQLQLLRRTLTRRKGLDRRSACDQGSRQSTKKGVSMYRATAPCKRRRTSHPQPTKRTCKLIEYRGLRACIHLHVHDVVHPRSNKATIIYVSQHEINFDPATSS